MSLPIFDPEFWAGRLANAIQREQIRAAVYDSPEDLWKQIRERHRTLLGRYINPRDSILDVGCAWGRLLSFLPSGWLGHYLGVDLSVDFIKLARRTYPDRDFLCHDLREPIPEILIPGRYGGDKYTWGVAISVKAMVIQEAGKNIWEVMQANILSACNSLLVLEYDVNDPGEVIR